VLGDFAIVHAHMTFRTANGVQRQRRYTDDWQRQQITALSARYAFPAAYPWREFAVDGGLASYGSSSIREAYRQSGIYVGQILKGAKAEELPVQQPTELVVNLKIAKALGLDLPRSVDRTITPARDSQAGLKTRQRPPN
jgi:hypothetical protein